MNTSSNPNSAYMPAGFFIRFFAWVVDLLIWLVIQIAVGGILGVFTGGSQSAWVQAIAFGILVLIAYFYNGWFYSNKGGTPGKLVFSLRVIDTDTGKLLTYWKAFLREGPGKAMSTLLFMIGYFMVLFRKDRLALHDLFFRTQVQELQSK